MDMEKFSSYRDAARQEAFREMQSRQKSCNPELTAITAVTSKAIEQYETWLSEYDFGWERILDWKKRPTHTVALDIAVWYEGVLAGLCWATPKDSKEKVFVIYIQRNPDARMPTRGLIAPLCLAAVRSYAALMGLRYVVIPDPIPQARRAYEREGFVYRPGIGLAYDLTHDYDPSIEEERDHDD